MFWILWSQESSASNVVRFGLETKKLWPFEDKPRKAKAGIFFISQPCPPFEGCFAAAKPPFGTRVPLRSTRTPISQLQNGMQKFPSSAKSTPRCENASSLKNGLRNSHFVAKWFPNFEMATKWSPRFKMDTKWSSSFKMATKMLQASKWAAKFPFGCEMFSQPHSCPCEILHLLWKWPFDCKMIFQTSKWLWNDFQTSKWAAKKCFSFFLLASKWLRNGLRAMKWFAKTPYKAKGNCKNANKAPHHAFKVESPLTEITHTKPLTLFLTSLNHQSP